MSRPDEQGKRAQKKAVGWDRGQTEPGLAAFNYVRSVDGLVLFFNLWSSNGRDTDTHHYYRVSQKMPLLLSRYIWCQLIDFYIRIHHFNQKRSSQSLPSFRCCAVPNKVHQMSTFREVFGLFGGAMKSGILSIK